VNLGNLIHDRVPDENGNLLPVDLTSGTYDIKDLSSTYGSLAVNALAFDKTLGTRVGVPLPDCCAQGDPDLSPSHIDVSVDGFTTVAGTATNTCNGAIESIMDQLTYWSAVNPAIAQVTTGKVTGVSPGLTAANASGTVAICYGNTLHWENLNLSDPITVRPTITQSSNLWYFNGNPASTAATESANGRRPHKLIVAGHKVADSKKPRVFRVFPSFRA
jgi:hypothetical protein